MKFFILVLLSIITISCGSVVDDPSIPIVDANYPSLEIIAKDKVFNGLAYFEIEEDKKFSDLGIAVQGYYQGEIRIFSEACDVNETRVYKDSQKINLNYSFNVDELCVFSVVMGVDYPKRGTTVTHPFKGTFVVAPKKATESEIIIEKIPTGISKKISFSFDEDATVYFRGCNSDQEAFFPSHNGKVEITITDYIIPTGFETCAPQLAVIGESRKKRVRLLLAFHSPKIVPLGIPLVEFDKKKLKITAQGIVAVVSVGEEYKLKNKANLKYQIGDIIRIMTVKGRLQIGIVKEGFIEWI